MQLDLSVEHRRIVLDLLAEHLPPEGQAWAFSSRASGHARRYSDLDLTIDTGRRLTLDEAAVLREAFEESDLPYRVDIVDWHTLDERFCSLIARERVLLAQ